MLCSSKDILMRVVAQNLSPESALLEKVAMILFCEVTIQEIGLFCDVFFFFWLVLIFLGIQN